MNGVRTLIIGIFVAVAVGSLSWLFWEASTFDAKIAANQTAIVDLESRLSETEANLRNFQSTMNRRVDEAAHDTQAEMQHLAVRIDSVLIQRLIAPAAPQSLPTQDKPN